MKIRTMAMAALAAAVVALPCSAEENIKVTINGSELTFDQPPIMENDRVLVPFRAIFEGLGAQVKYDGDSHSIFASKGITSMWFEIGADTIYTDSGTLKLDVPSKLVNDRTLVPVRAVSEGLDALVDWNSETKTVVIETKKTDHSIKEEKISKELKTDGEKVYATIDVKYPVIENTEDDEKIAKVNEALKKYAEETAASYENDENFGETSDYIKEMERPFVYDMNYGVTYDKNGLLSVEYMLYVDLHGAHPTTVVSSAVYDMATGELLTDANVFKKDADMSKFFIAEIDADPTAFFEDAKKTVGEKAYEGFYLSEKGAVLYYNTYGIAPYAAGLQTVNVSYDDNADVFEDEFLKAFSEKEAETETQTETEAETE